MILNTFNGGLSQKVSPNLIALNEAQVCANIDTSVGKLAPLKDDTYYDDGVSWLNKPNFYWFEGNWVREVSGTSFTTFSNILYWSKGTGPLQFTKNGSDIFDVGIEAPTEAPTLDAAEEPTITASQATSGSSDLSTDTYNYRVVVYYGNKYNYQDITIDYTGSRGININISGVDSIDKLYVYRLYEAKYRLIKSDFDVSNGVIAIDNTLDISDKSSLSYLPGYTYESVRQYCYTYYSSSYGHESSPSPYTDETVILGSVELSNFGTSTNEAVNQIRLYRIGGDLTNMTLVGTYDIPATTVVDSSTDLELAENGLLSTIGLIKPPDGLNYLTTYNSTLFAAIDSKLYFSELALPSNWSELNTIQLQDSITGIGATQNGLLIFTRNRTFLLRGTDASNFSLIMLNGSQGCVNHSTINYVNNTLIWLSLDGICSSIGADITVLTEQKLGRLSLTSYSSVVFDNQYFLFASDKTYVIDFRYGSVIVYNLDEVYKGGHYSYFYDRLFLYRSSDDTIVKFADSDINRDISYRTGWLSSNGVTNAKVYKKLYIFTIGETQLTTYVDGVKSLGSFELDDGYNEIQLPQDSTRGYYFEIEFFGKGEVVQIELITEEERLNYNG